VDVSSEVHHTAHGVPWGPDLGDDWFRDSARENLQLIAEGVTELAGWGIAAIRVVRGSGAGAELELVALAGADPASLGSRTPVATLEAELEVAEDWGALRFIPHERLPDSDGGAWVVPEMTPSAAVDAWHPLDMLVAPLYDREGQLRGTLTIDLPADGRRPGPEGRRLLERVSQVAGRTVVAAVERDDFAQRVEAARRVKEVVRLTSAQLDLTGLLVECEKAVTDCFEALGMWIHTFGDRDSSRVRSTEGRVVELPEPLVRIAESVALHCWRHQEVVTLDAHGPGPSPLSAQERRLILGFLQEIQVDSLVLAPLGAGPECLGSLALTRARRHGEWTAVERAALLDLGHDVGRAVLNARTFERERRLVGELRELGSYKGQLISTVSHELKNPLGALTGRLEIVEASEDLPPMVRTSLVALRRSTTRMERVTEDLLLLGKVGDPRRPLTPEPVDLADLVREACSITEMSASTKDIQVVVEAPPGPVLATGEAAELDRVALNLISNAVKYTPEGRCVRVRLAREGDQVVLSCTDDGIGISEEDQELLFTEFFRSSNPVAATQPGTGLGLAIVQRIVKRHQGTIEVESALGQGSTFTVRLPAAAGA
jgi:signal transduction histidine kinase